MQPDSRERPRTRATAPQFHRSTKATVSHRRIFDASASPHACERDANGSNPRHSHRRSRCSSRRHRNRMQSSGDGGDGGSCRGQNSHRSRGDLRRAILHFDCFGPFHCFALMVRLRLGPMRARKTRRGRRWIRSCLDRPILGRPMERLDRRMARRTPRPRRGLPRRRDLWRRRHQTRLLTSPERQLPGHSTLTYA
jgi:hypothetical protein